LINNNPMVEEENAEKLLRKIKEEVVDDLPF
jgi:hypothetical protein